MGGMAAFIPSKDEERNNRVLNKVKADKSLEANNGHDGTWIAHPALLIRQWRYSTIFSAPAKPA